MFSDSTLFENDYFKVTIPPGESIVTVVRSSKSFESAAAARAACNPMLTSLDNLGRRHHYLLLDSRQAVSKNDPEYENWFRSFRRDLVVDFPRVAYLVQTVAGQMQAKRNRNPNKNHIQSRVRCNTDPRKRRRLDQVHGGVRIPC